MRYPIVRPVIAVVYRLSVLIALASVASVSTADPRRLFFSVEPAEKSTEAPPTTEQTRTVDDALETLSQRIRALDIEGHVEAPSEDKADVLVQVTSVVSSRGLRVDAKIYDQASKAWYAVTKELVAITDATRLELELANRILPLAIVRLFELGLPMRRPIMLADCVFPGQNSAESLRSTGLTLSSNYPHDLSAKNQLKERFSIVRLVPTMEPGFYRWWCIDAAATRKGALRNDTVTVYGYLSQVDAAGNPDLQLVFHRQAQIQTSPNITITDRKAAIRQIADIVEKLANDQ